MDKPKRTYEQHNCLVAGMLSNVEDGIDMLELRIQTLFKKIPELTADCVKFRQDHPELAGPSLEVEQDQN